MAVPLPITCPIGGDAVVSDQPTRIMSISNPEGGNLTFKDNSDAVFYMLHGSDRFVSWVTPLDCPNGVKVSSSSITASDIYIQFE